MDSDGNTTKHCGTHVKSAIPSLFNNLLLMNLYYIINYTIIIINLYLLLSISHTPKRSLNKLQLSNKLLRVTSIRSKNLTFLALE